MRHHQQQHLQRWAVILCAIVLAGCAAHDRTPADSVATAWRQRQQSQTPPLNLSHTRSMPEAIIHQRDSLANEPLIATVNNRPIARSRLVHLLLRSRGAAVLEQLIGLETAATTASKKGLTITQADVDREYDRALRRLADPLSSVTPEPFDRRAADRLLETVLSERNVSREEFELIIRRNTYLRKIVESETLFTDEQLRQEFKRLYGTRVQVRHIQLATLGEVERVKERLAAGEDFGELAARYSANKASAKGHGLLDPFSTEDEEVPALLREVAFSLEPGEVSGAVRIGEWYHVIKLEEVLPTQNRSFEEVREELERSLRERATEPAMYELLEKLFQQATIEIHDPALKAAFDRKHRDRAP